MPSIVQATPTAPFASAAAVSGSSAEEFRVAGEMSLGEVAEESRNEVVARLSCRRTLPMRPSSRPEELVAMKSMRTDPEESMWRGIQRQHGFDSPKGYMEWTSQDPRSLGTPVSPSGSGVQAVPACCRTGSALLSQYREAKRATLCKEAEWVMFNQDDPEQLPVFISKPLRLDGSSGKLLPRSLLQSNADLPTSEAMEKALVGLTGHAQLLRCRSFECYEGDADLPWLHSPCKRKPISQGILTFPCARTSISTADEWSHPLHVE